MGVHIPSCKCDHTSDTRQESNLKLTGSSYLLACTGAGEAWCVKYDQAARGPYLHAPVPYIGLPGRSHSHAACNSVCCLQRCQGTMCRCNVHVWWSEIGMLGQGNMLTSLTQPGIGEQHCVLLGSGSKCLLCYTANSVFLFAWRQTAFHASPQVYSRMC